MGRTVVDASAGRALRVRWAACALALAHLAFVLALTGLPDNAQAAGTRDPRPAAAVDQCFEFQAARFGLDSSLLRSIAIVESGMRPEVDNNTHLQRTGSRDIGLMQINTGWLPALRRHGIGLADLREPCTNIEVGAWILADLIRRHGNSWDAVGAYNAACTQLSGDACRRARSQYAWKVWRSQQRSALQRRLDVLTEGALDRDERRPRPTAPGLLSTAHLVTDAVTKASTGSARSARSGSTAEAGEGLVALAHLNAPLGGSLGLGVSAKDEEVLP